MPGIMLLRPVGAGASKATKASTSTRTENVAEERERAAVPPWAQVFKGPRVHPMNTTAAFRPILQSNPQICRSKQVTDPLPENVKARLVDGSGKSDGERVNYSSSGSEHEPSSICLAAMVHEFMEEEAVEAEKSGRNRCSCDGGSCNACVARQAEEDDPKSRFSSELTQKLQGLVSCINKREFTLLADVVKAMNAKTGDAVEDSQFLKECDANGCNRRSVMRQLRQLGYDAALCKSRWNNGGTFPGGDYEYIDIDGASLASGTASERLIVEIDFQSQFEIARPTSHYKALFQALPSVYVGTPCRLQQILDVMAEAVKRSLKKKGMLLPPWRKPEYMNAKWFAWYRRTTNGAPQSKRTKESVLRDISFVALTGPAWDKKFINEMELEFEKAGSRQPLKAMENGVLPLGGAHKASENKVPTEGTEPEGKVHGGNLLKHLWKDAKDVIIVEIPEIDDMDWHPPALLPRSPVQRNVATGLSTILREAGLTSNNQQTVPLAMAA